jgi:hypothetical protein
MIDSRNESRGNSARSENPAVPIATPWGIRGIMMK